MCGRLVMSSRRVDLAARAIGILLFASIEHRGVALWLWAMRM
jgi:hypothetical protein